MLLPRPTPAPMVNVKIVYAVVEKVDGVHSAKIWFKAIEKIGEGPNEICVSDKQCSVVRDAGSFVVWSGWSFGNTSPYKARQIA